ncbi:MAG: hypothetical protein HYZ93_01035 [Candidatus Omnitrophica bacterium]|nr:hypothetical protein [Candidatus Omnitrophota bacterium]
MDDLIRRRVQRPLLRKVAPAEYFRDLSKLLEHELSQPQVLFIADALQGILRDSGDMRSAEQRRMAWELLSQVLARTAGGPAMFAWATPWAERMGGIGAQVYDGMINVTRPDRPVLAESAELTRFLGGNGRALVVPAAPSPEGHFTQPATVWVHRGIRVPEAWRKSFQVRELIAEAAAEAGEALAEARPGDLVLLNGVFATEETREDWLNLLKEKGIVGLRVMEGDDLGAYSQRELVTVVAILQRAGILLYDLSSVRATEIERQRQLIFYL